MKILRSLVCLVALFLAVAPAWSLGVNGGLDQLDTTLQYVRSVDSDPAHQAAIDAARAKLADPKITTIEKQVLAYAAATAIVEKSYGTLDAFATTGGFLMTQLDAGITLPVLTLEGQCQGVLLEYLSSPGSIVSLTKKLQAIANYYTKVTDPVKTPDRAKRLKGMAKAAKKFAAFYKRYHHTK